MQISSNSQIAISFFCLVLLVVFVSLGTWQLDRANERSAEADDILNLSQANPIEIRSSNLDSLKAYAPAHTRGKYLFEEQFLLDNIIYKGKPGYYLITPFKLTDTDSVLLVNRGWLPKTDALPKLPDLSFDRKLENQTEEIQGVLAHPRSKPVIGGDLDSPVSPTPPLWFYMDLPFFVAKTNLDVLPFVLRLNPETDSRFVRDWPKYKVKTGMHIGYAIQWFVFALFVLIGWIGILYKSRQKDEKTQ